MTSWLRAHLAESLHARNASMRNEVQKEEQDPFDISSTSSSEEANEEPQIQERSYKNQFHPEHGQPSTSTTSTRFNEREAADDNDSFDSDSVPAFGADETVGVARKAGDCWEQKYKEEGGAIRAEDDKPSSVNTLEQEISDSSDEEELKMFDPPEEEETTIVNKEREREESDSAVGVVRIEEVGIVARQLARIKQVLATKKEDTGAACDAGDAYRHPFFSAASSGEEESLTTESLTDVCCLCAPPMGGTCICCGEPGPEDLGCVGFLVEMIRTICCGEQEVEIKIVYEK